MRMSAMGQKRTCTRFKFGIYGRVCGAIAISFNRGSNEECHAVSCFRAAHVSARLFGSHRDETSRDVLEQA
jgi:hypothetical protein